ncbi:MAG: glycosyltransferase family 2 protein [Planctomycetota bacterium]
MDLSILVVSFNTRELTLRCLETVFEETDGVTFEVRLIDNASNDGSAEAIAERFPQVHLIASEENHGFAAANNLLAAEAEGEWLLLLNPDTEVLDRAIPTMLEFARVQAGPVIVGGRTVFADRRLNPSSCWGRPTPWSVFCMASGLSTLFPRTRWFEPETLGRWPRDTVREVDIISGCFLLVERSRWNELGGFDPDFFMYGEDADLCLRAERAGITRIVCPDATIVHHAGASERASRAGKMLRLLRAKSQLFSKYWSRPAAWFGRRMLSLWSGTRCCAFGLLRFFRTRWAESYRTWRDVWRGRAAWLDLEPSTPAPSTREEANRG